MCSLDCRLERRVLPGDIAKVDQKELQKQMRVDTVPLPLSHVSCFLLFPTPLTLLEEQPKCCQCCGQRKEGRDLKMDKPSSCLQNLKVILMSYCC